MTILEAIVLGIVQGLTEFLPVSSSGHLVLFQRIFGIEGDMLFFDTMLHVATLVAVVVVFWQDIVSILRRPIQKLTGLLVIATIPAVVATLLFGDFFDAAFGGKYLGYGFILTGILLTVAEKVSARRRERKNKKDVSAGNAALMGCMQAVAILPGISRSGSTLVGGLFTGIDRNLAARFSFLMSIPVILGSLVLQSVDLLQNGVGHVEIAPTLVGMLFAAVAGFFAIRFMLELIRKKKLYGFAIYVAVLGILVVADQLVFHLVF
ncbi:MAG: undecaprenyl-diphosphate phosphatase [Christensenellaceae bacterium]|nr:undecaprenyl-diphosphate phosphatase [Christensenellaceae bacterium]